MLGDFPYPASDRAQRRISLQLGAGSGNDSNAFATLLTLMSSLKARELAADVRSER